MTKTIKRALLALASGSLLVGALVLQGGTAHAVLVGSLNVSPTAGSDLAPLTLTTGGACSDPSATYIMATISGSGFAVDGTIVVGAIQITALNTTGTGYVIPVTNTLAAIASLHAPAVTYVGNYVFDVRCRAALDPTSLGDFTATIHFTNPHTWSIGPMTAPYFTVAAHLTGTARVGDTSGCSAYVAGQTSLQYVWLRNGAVIAGATQSTYVAQPADYAHYLGCELIAKNAAGNTTSKSGAWIVAAGHLINFARPTISGHAIRGYTLTCHVGSWSPAPTAYTYTWWVGSSRTAGATRYAFKIPTSYVGHTVACQVVASRPGYTNVAAATSAVKVS
jgi:hypothetical protein